jgi:hypothetical protein
MREIYCRAVTTSLNLSYCQIYSLVRALVLLSDEVPFHALLSRMAWQLCYSKCEVHKISFVRHLNGFQHVGGGGEVNLSPIS